MKKKLLFFPLFLLFCVAASFAQPCSVQLVVDNPLSCHGDCAGVLEAQATGSGTITYTWLPNVSTGFFATGLCAGTYKVTATDGNNCVSVDSITLVQPDSIIVTNTITNIRCGGDCSGVITSVVTGGNPPLMFNWDTPNQDTTKDIDSVCAGSYCLTVTDQNGCLYTQCNILVTSPDPITIEQFVSQYSNTGVSCNGATDGSIYENVTGGTHPLTYHWNTTASDTNALYNIGAGTYILTLTDSNNCIARDTAILTQPDPFSLSVSTSDYHGFGVSCYGSTNGSICLALSGQTSPYTYDWADPLTSSDSCVTNLTGPSDGIGGTYCVTIFDFNGCSLDTCFIINEPDQVSDNPVVNDASCGTCADGSIVISPFGGARPYAFAWTPNVSTDSANLALLPGTYMVCTSDANGCTTESCDSLVVGPPLGVRNIVQDLAVSISPNPSNGRFSLVCKTHLDNATISIVDMLGKEVYHASLLTGNQKDIDLKAPAGIYFVQIITETGKWVGRFAVE